MRDSVHGHEQFQRKTAGNRARDLHNETAIREQGWHVVTVWECALRTAKARQWLEKRLPRLLGGPWPVAAV